MLLALAPILVGLVNGLSIESVIGAVTVSQWVGIGEAVLNAAPAEISLLQGLHSVFADMIGRVLAVGSSAVAPIAVKEWLAANGAAAIERQPGISSES